VIVWSLISESQKRAKILDYIWEKSLDKDPKITKSDIMKHLKDSRPMTTHKITIELIKEGKIKMVKPKDKPYSQIDYLVINENNEFNWIYRELSEIDDILNQVSKSMDHVDSCIKNDPDGDKLNSNTHFNDFLGDCEKAVGDLLQVLLILTNKFIQSEKDSHLLNSTIVDLMLKSNLIFSGQEEMEYVYFDLNDDSHDLNLFHKEVNYLAKKHKLNFDFVTNLTELIEKFKKKILDKTANKSTLEKMDKAWNLKIEKFKKEFQS
jgi:hypothetical protein